MPANLTPQYLKAEKEYRQAKATEEKIACLEAMLRLIPKHKGTDHMQGDIKRKLARLRTAATKGSRAKKSPVFKVEKEGAGQVVLLGPPNAGKSQLMATLTKANAAVADYPYTTHVPQPGMMKFEDIQIQLVDTPPITADYMDPWMSDLVRRADAAVLVADMGNDDFLDDVETILKRLESVKVVLARAIPQDAAKQLSVFRRAAVAANKMDMPGAEQRLDMLREFFADRFDIWPVSAAAHTNLDAFRRRVFELLQIIRVYTKEPGKKPDMAQPYTVTAGSTLLDLAAKVHREFEHTLKSARLWGSAKYAGIRVKRDYVLSDGDIVELHE